MKFTLIYPEIREGFPDFKGDYSDGIASILTCLRNAGHEASLFHITSHITKEVFLQELEKRSPDLVAFSAMTNTFKYVEQYATWVKENLSIPVMAGGIHATVNSEEVINLSYIDIIAIGEGEEAIVNFCNRMEQGENISDTQGFWVKNENGIHKNPVHPLTTDLDTLPTPDRSFFDYEHLLSSQERIAYFTASRGCPYDCTYCANTSLKNTYNAKKAFIRFKSVPKAIEEIKQNLEHYPFIKYVFFQDDILPMRKEWFREFAEAYKREINVPYYCNIYPGMVDEETVRLLKHSGCATAAVGIESGNEEIRRNLLKRKVSDAKIENAFRLFREQGIKTRAYNMVGLPTETRETIFDTIDLNARIKPDFSGLAIYYPYPSTALYDTCIEKGMMSDETADTYYEKSVLNQPALTNDETVFALWYFKFFTVILQTIYAMPFPKGMESFLIGAVRKTFCFKWLPVKALTSVSKAVWKVLRVVYLKFVIKFYSRQKKFFNS